MSGSDSLLVERPAPRRAPKLLVDLSEIDLSATTLTRDELERWNPHRGQIVQLDRVIWAARDLSAAIGVKRVRDDEFWVEGHFPGRPLMPGVLMIEAGAQLASYLFYARRGESSIAGFTRIDKTVFRGAVEPGMDLILICRAVKYRPKRFVNDLQGVVDGRIVFQSRITGMVIPDSRSDAQSPSSG